MQTNKPEISSGPVTMASRLFVNKRNEPWVVSGATEKLAPVSSATAEVGLTLDDAGAESGVPGGVTRGDENAGEGEIDENRDAKAVNAMDATQC